MQKLSFRKISILGLVLMAASAVTAAVLPKSDNKLDKFAAGSLTDHSSLNNAGAVSSITCAPTLGAIGQGCNYSTADGSETTGADLGGNDDSTSNSSLPADGGLGGNNTSDNA